MTDSLADAVERDATALRDELHSGTWRPTAAEQQLADDLAHGHWDAHWLRSGLRDHPTTAMGGRLLAVLHPAATVAESAGSESADRALLALRTLIDAIAPAP
ncbi:hypothetical protein [Streptomyces olivoreticuli]|uniref:hypothetical protein n=1 Tax=Streptomyces olivoreticuli TaxID=68246 RepID=UPI000E287917|nr:hypothetical protein [Streptomyces olivoreticuli]